MSFADNKNTFYPEMGDEDALDKGLQAMSSWSAPATKSKEEAWQQLMASIEAPAVDKIEAPVVSFRSRFARYGMGAAALIAIMLISTLFLKLSGTKQVVAPRGEFANADLPDGSKVVLNSDSKLTYSRFGWDKHRKVSLVGEAVFEVTKGNDFEVHTTVGYVRVLGTKFNVAYRDKNLEVDCIEGRVEVNLSNGRKEILVAGQGLEMDSDLQVIKKELNMQTVGKWVDGEFYYREVSLEVVLNEIERQYNIRIQATGIANRKYSGYFRKGDLNETLDLVCQPMGLTYSIQGKVVVIK